MTGPLQNTAGAEKFPLPALQRMIRKARNGFPAQTHRACAEIMRNKIQGAMAHA